MRRLLATSLTLLALAGCADRVVAPSTRASVAPRIAGSSAPLTLPELPELPGAVALPTPGPSFPAGGSLHAPAGATQAQRALALVNNARALAGVASVSLDDAMSAACAKHAHYLILNQGKPAVAGLLAHQEDASLPGATPEGADAGIHADIAYDPPDTEVLAWLCSIYHRTPILDSRVVKVGFAREEAADGYSASLLMFRYDTQLPYREVRFPADAQTDVGVAFRGETPDPLPAGAQAAGYPITLDFAGGHATKVHARLTDAAGTELPVYLSDPEHPSDADHQGNVACLFPQDVLRAQTNYRVHLDAEVDGSARSWDWGFTTEAERPFDAQDYDGLLAATGHAVAVSGDVKLVEDKDGAHLLWLQTRDPNWVRVQLPAAMPFDPTRYVARRVTVHGGAWRESPDAMGLRLTRAEDLAVLTDPPPLVDGLDEAALAAAVNKLSSVRGKVARAGTTTDGHGFISFKEPPHEHTAFVDPTVWHALASDPAALTGKTITLRCLPRDEGGIRYTFEIDQADQLVVEPS